MRQTVSAIIYNALRLKDGSRRKDIAAEMGWSTAGVSYLLKQPVTPKIDLDSPLDSIQQNHSILFNLSNQALKLAIYLGLKSQFNLALVEKAMQSQLH